MGEGERCGRGGKDRNVVWFGFEMFREAILNVESLITLVLFGLIRLIDNADRFRALTTGCLTADALCC